MHYEDFLSSQSACGRAELLRTEIGGRFCYRRASKVLLVIYFLVLFVWYCTDPNTLSYPTRRGNWATYKRWKSEHDPFPQLFPGIWCKIVKMFRYIKKGIYIWIVEATDSIFSEWMRKLSWLWSFSIKTAHSVSTITFYMNVSICWHGNYLTSYALNFVVNTVVIQYCVYYEI